ncbi:MAG TPA: dihydroorotate dehydrogenase electron transfer subunit [Solirubrobacteraceae bacterium]|nr:dihydroorotate dehydrogenase electron transfer subunit [Solirubrobacteraceae bacterium]
MSLAPPHRRELRVTANEALGAYRVLRVAAPDRAPGESAPEPGQFAMIAAVERWGGGGDERPYLPRAFSIARCREGEWHFLLEDVGPGTKRLCELHEGSALWALGPLGRPFALPAPGGRAVLVGGGVGIAPLAILQDTLAGPAPVLLGFRDAAHAQGAALLQDALVATDDGSVGHDGRVTELLARELDSAEAQAGRQQPVVYACGPPAMLEAVRALCAQTGTPAQLALEAGMACGYGACYGCAVPRVDGSYLRVCVDGPVVDASELAEVVEPGAYGEVPA